MATRETTCLVGFLPALLFFSSKAILHTCEASPPSFLLRPDTDIRLRVGGRKEKGAPKRTLLLLLLRWRYKRHILPSPSFLSRQVLLQWEEERGEGGGSIHNTIARVWGEKHFGKKRVDLPPPPTAGLLIFKENSIKKCSGVENNFRVSEQQFSQFHPVGFRPFSLPLACYSGM